MTISSNFLCENDPRKNLEILASFKPSDTTGTKCTTEKAYKQLPKTNISPSTLREICLLGTGFTLLSIPFLITGKKVVECFGLFKDLEWSNTSKCAGDLLGNFSKPVNTLQILSFASMVAMGGISAYTGARLFFQDKNQVQRFESLDKEYTAVAKCLIDQYGSAKKKEREAIVETARRISRNGDLIRTSLSQVIRLSVPQANLLTAKITHAAQEVLANEERFASKQPAMIPQMPRVVLTASAAG